MSEEILVPLNDSVFKYIMIKNKEFRNYILKEIISDIKEEELEKIKIENVELITFNKREKRKRVDILLNIEDEIYINLEANNEYYEGIIKKNMSYLRKIVNDKIKVGANYNNDKSKIIQINFNNFNYGKGRINKYIYYDKENSQELGDNKEVYHINLDLIRKVAYNEINRKEQLFCALKFMGARNIKEIEESINEHEMLKKVRKDYMDLVEEYGIGVYDGEEQDRFIMNTKVNNAVKKATEEVTKDVTNKVTKELTRNTVINMLKDNVDIKLISKYTNLPIKDIEKIKLSMK